METGPGTGVGKTCHRDPAVHRALAELSYDVLGLGSTTACCHIEHGHVHTCTLPLEHGDHCRLPIDMARPLADVGNHPCHRRWQSASPRSLSASRAGRAKLGCAWLGKHHGLLLYRTRPRAHVRTATGAWRPLSTAHRHGPAVSRRWKPPLPPALANSVTEIPQCIACWQS